MHNISTTEDIDAFLSKLKQQKKKVSAKDYRAILSKLPLMSRVRDYFEKEVKKHEYFIANNTANVSANSDNNHGIQANPMPHPLTPVKKKSHKEDIKDIHETIEEPKSKESIRREELENQKLRDKLSKEILAHESMLLNKQFDGFKLFELFRDWKCANLVNCNTGMTWETAKRICELKPEENTPDASNGSKLYMTYYIYYYSKFAESILIEKIGRVKNFALRDTLQILHEKVQGIKKSVDSKICGILNEIGKSAYFNSFTTYFPEWEQIKNDSLYSGAVSKFIDDYINKLEVKPFLGGITVLLVLKIKYYNLDIKPRDLYHFFNSIKDRLNKDYGKTIYNRLTIYIDNGLIDIDFNYDDIYKDVEEHSFEKHETLKKITNDKNKKEELKQKKEEFDNKPFEPVNIPYEPKSSNDKDLFEYAVKRMAHKLQSDKDILDYKTHQEWPGFCFGKLDISAHTRLDYMSSIKAKYSEYFINDESTFKYAFDFVKIKRDFPSFFVGYVKKDDHDSPINKMIAAVVTEINLSKQPKQREKYKVIKIREINASKKIYALELKVGDDMLISANESNANLYVNDKWYNCECLDFNEEDSILYVTTTDKIRGSYGTIYFDATFILEALLERLKGIIYYGFDKTFPGYKFLYNNTQNIEHLPFRASDLEPITNGLDQSQRLAIKHVLKSDISFIWGPPGSGKSFTLATLISILFQKKESTLVCCISNVAVDQLVNKVIDNFESLDIKPSNCEIIRAGSTTDSRLLSVDYLFPKDATVDNLRKRIKELNYAIKIIPRRTASQSNLAKQLELLQDRSELKESLKKHIDNIISRSYTISTTIANYMLSTNLHEKQFDNLIIDEASMVAIPYLIGLSKKVAKRIIIVGDPMQLSPIALSPEGLMTESIFDYSKVLGSQNHPALKKLLAQRRSHEFIVNLTNKQFYNNELQSMVKTSPDWVVEGPFPGKVIKVINSDIEDNEVKFIGETRRNFGTRDEGMKILSDFHEHFINTHKEISIGVITPFRGQVKLYKSAILQNSVNDGFWENIKVGTIHTFQGSECDVIILDIVEAAPTKVSKILYKEEGERLINVALSRARHKLIVIGDTKRFDSIVGTSSVSDKVSNILKRMRDIIAYECVK